MISLTTLGDLEKVALELVRERKVPLEEIYHSLWLVVYEVCKEQKKDSPHTLGLADFISNLPEQSDFELSKQTEMGSHSKKRFISQFNSLKREYGTNVSIAGYVEKQTTSSTSTQ